MKKIKTVTLPGSKSFTNRALILASLADGKSKLFNFSKSDDSRVMIEILKSLGIEIIEKEDYLIVNGNQGQFAPIKKSFNVGLAGTTMRFLTALCSLIPGEIILDGDKRMRERPIADLVKGLEQLGVKIEFLNKNGYPPIKIFGRVIKGGEISVNGSVSSQFISALLLISPLFKKGLKIKVIGKQISRSYIDMTIETMNHFGVKVINNNYRQYWVKNNQKIKAANYLIEADVSGASYFWAMAAVTGIKIRVRNINPLSCQGDIKFVDILQKMGCLVRKNIKKSWIEVKGPKILSGVTVNMENMPDTAPTLAVVAAFAKGKTKITGLSTLKIKETDRLTALKNELNKMKIRSEITSDSITIIGGKPEETIIETYGDHRIAMAFAVAKLRLPRLVIKNPEVVSKSFPDFWEKFNLIKN